MNGCIPDGALPRLRTWTVRSRIVGLLTVLTLLSVFAAGTVAYFVERSRVIEQIDVNLQAALESGSFTVSQEPWESTEQALAAVVQRLAPDDNTGTPPARSDSCSCTIEAEALGRTILRYVSRSPARIRNIARLPGR